MKINQNKSINWENERKLMKIKAKMKGKQRTKKFRILMYFIE